MTKNRHLAYAFRLAHLMTFEDDPIKLNRLKKLWLRHLDYYLGGNNERRL